MASSSSLPLPAARALRKLGIDLRDARRRRRIPTQVMAERAGISRTTLAKAEKGEPGVSMGTVATLLYILGLDERLSDVADLSHDEVGRDLSDELLPQRIRTKNRETP